MYVTRDFGRLPRRGCLPTNRLPPYRWADGQTTGPRPGRGVSLHHRVLGLIHRGQSHRSMNPFSAEVKNAWTFPPLPHTSSLCGVSLPIEAVVPILVTNVLSGQSLSEIKNGSGSQNQRLAWLKWYAHAVIPFLCRVMPAAGISWRRKRGSCRNTSLLTAAGH